MSRPIAGVEYEIASRRGGADVPHWVKADSANTGAAACGWEGGSPDCVCDDFYPFIIYKWSRGPLLETGPRGRSTGSTPELFRSTPWAQT